MALATPTMGCQKMDAIFKSTGNTKAQPLPKAHELVSEVANRSLNNKTSIDIEGADALIKGHMLAFKIMA